jgi:hypothetical protein
VPDKKHPDYHGKLYFQDGEDGKIEVVSQITLPWSMEEIAAIMYETDLFTKWMKASDRQKVSVSMTPEPLIIGFENYITFPWPLEDRWANLISLTFMGEEEKDIVYTSFTYPKSKKLYLGSKVPRAPSGTTRFTIDESVRYFKQTEDGRVVVYELSVADFKINAPTWM